MKVPRLTVRWLMVAVAIVAVVLAAYVQIHPWWQSHQGMTLRGYPGRG
jgi:hypothetical protein